MADQKFTPGPWEWEHLSDEYGPWALIGGNDEDVLRHFWLQGSSSGMDIGEANARLIAKSPEMYEALKAFRSEYPTILTETEEEWRACNYCNHSYPPGKDKHNEGCPWGTAQALLRNIDHDTPPS